MPHYYGPGIWSNIYSFVALCVFPSCLQWDYKWKWEDNLCGQVGPNLIISFQSGFFSLCTMYFMLLWGNILNLMLMLPSVMSACVCVYMEILEYERFKRNYFSINDIELYRMHVHGSWILQYLQLQVLPNLNYSILW